MKTEKYIETLSEGSGHLNPFPEKHNDKGPDYGGYIKIENKLYRVAAWVHEKKKKKFLSLRLNEIEKIPINHFS